MCVMHGIMVPSFFLIVSVKYSQNKMGQCVSFTALWLVKYCHMCDLQHHGTDLFWPILRTLSILK